MELSQENSLQITPKMEGYKCDYCNKNFSRKDNLTKHHKSCKEKSKKDIYNSKEELKDKIEEQECEIAELKERLEELSQKYEENVTNGIKTLKKDVKEVKVRILLDSFSSIFYSKTKCVLF